jgi:hypothetical protein
VYSAWLNALVCAVFVSMPQGVLNKSGNAAGKLCYGPFESSQF